MLAVWNKKFTEPELVSRVLLQILAAHSLKVVKQQSSQSVEMRRGGGNNDLIAKLLQPARV